MDADKRKELVHFLSVRASLVTWLLHAYSCVLPSRPPCQGQRGVAAWDWDGARVGWASPPIMTLHSRRVSQSWFCIITLMTRDG